LVARTSESCGEQASKFRIVITVLHIQIMMSDDAVFETSRKMRSTLALSSTALILQC